MKMKEACRATALTERAVRLYLSKRLVTPRRQNGIIHFSADDIRALKDISVLRQYDFSIEQIAEMLRDPLAIPGIMRSRVDKAIADIEHSQSVNSAFDCLRDARFHSVREFVSRLNERNALSKKPDFARFDEICAETRQREARLAERELACSERKARRRKIFVFSYVALVALVFSVFVFLSDTRLAGYISLAPVTILEKHDNGAMTVSVGDARAADIIGKDVITVPCRAYGREDEVGETIASGAQLAIRLTNFDLLRLGIHPWQFYQTQSAAVNDAWRETIVRALFSAAPGDNATLYIREICNLYPLFDSRSSDECGGV